MNYNNPNLSRINYYDIEAIKPDTSQAHVIDLVNPGKKVLELGAGSGVILNALRETKQCSVTAVDLHPSEKLIARVSSVHEADLNDPNWVKTFGDDEKFDVIIASDVLEHLYDPWTTLQQMRDLLSPNGEIVLSLPHASCSAVIAALLTENFAYDEEGLLDKTHIRFFGLKNIQDLHHGAGLIMTHARFLLRNPEDTELRRHWENLTYKQKVALSSHKEGLIYQVITKSTPATYAAGKSEIDLFSLPISMECRNYLSPAEIYVFKIFSEFLCSAAKIFRIGKRLSFLQTIAEKLHRNGTNIHQKASRGYW